MNFKANKTCITKCWSDCFHISWMLCPCSYFCFFILISWTDLTKLWDTSEINGKLQLLIFKLNSLHFLHITICTDDWTGPNKAHISEHVENLSNSVWMPKKTHILYYCVNLYMRKAFFTGFILYKCHWFALMKIYLLKIRHFKILVNCNQSS